VAQDVALSRPKQGFDSPTGHSAIPASDRTFYVSGSVRPPFYQVADSS
jgi:hypothetical protein